jgi:UDP-glucose 4-epimerase
LAKVLVTGGAGFIGSHLVQALLDCGHQVRVLDSLTTGREENLEALPVDLRIGDIQHPAVVMQAVRGIDFVFHLAALVSVAESMADPLGCYAVNLTGSLNVLAASAEARVRRVVLASSAAVYGNVEGCIDESTPTRPVSAYGASKLAMEGAAWLYSSAYGLPTVCLRLFNVYGPRQSPDSPYAAVIPLFVGQMLASQSPTIDGDGGQTRDFVFVTDAARAFMLAAERGDAAGDVFNIAGGRSISILDVYTSIRQQLGSLVPAIYGPPRPGDIHTSAADIRQAEARLGFCPETGLDEGTKETIEWFQARKNPARR